MKNLILIIICSILSMNTAHAESFDHNSWSILLDKHVYAVRNGKAAEVDYDGFLKDRGELSSYLNQLSNVAQVEFDQWPTSDQLAFLLNAYNAWTVELALTGYPDIESVRDLGNLIFPAFGKDIVPLFGNVISLNYIEKDLILKSDRYKESRVHFALNCASISCPALREEAFSGDHLEIQLTEQMNLFLGDEERNYLDGSTLRVSKIFSWYDDDFEDSDENFDDLDEYFIQHVELLNLSPSEKQIIKSGNFKVKFLFYDWDLNKKN